MVQMNRFAGQNLRHRTNIWTPRGEAARGSGSGGINWEIGLTYIH